MSLNQVPLFAHRIMPKNISDDMKKYFAALSILIFIFIFSVAENLQQKKGSAKPLKSAANSGDLKLLNEARLYFKPLPKTVDNPANPITVNKVLLGRYLYNDPRLSATVNSSCNSCHVLKNFGVDHIQTSEGGMKKVGNRNAPTTFNAALHFTQFWDGRAKTIEDQAGGPILNVNEMAIPSKEYLEKKIRQINLYKTLFPKAFPNEKNPISFLNIEKAIAAFERTLLTPSKFDDFLKGNVNALNSDEKKGLKTFITVGCTNCHNGVAIGGNTFQKFGLFADYRKFTKSTIPDEGRKNITKKMEDKDYFKVPSLRNVAHTYPYFHDGSIAELPTAVRIMGKIQLNKDLNEDEVNEIIDFLRTLSGDISDEAKKVPDSF